jgi:hypothetical protein
MNVLFLQPPEMISMADEALAFNLKFGRYDGCFAYEKAGPRGEGFYVTDLGRSLGARMQVKVGAETHHSECHATEKLAICINLRA